VSTAIAASLKDRALAQHREDVARYEEEEAKRAAEEQTRALDSLYSALEKYVDADIDTVSVEWTNDGPVATVDDLVFAWRRGRFAEYHGARLHVAVPCNRSCDKGPVWEEVQSLSRLGAILDEPGGHRHVFDCLVQYDEEGEPTTDRDGNPLPPRQPSVITSAEDPAITAIKAMRAAIAKHFPDAAFE
jgi:hypothetical protein